MLGSFENSKKKVESNRSSDHCYFGDGHGWYVDDGDGDGDGEGVIEDGAVPSFACPSPPALPALVNQPLFQSDPDWTLDLLIISNEVMLMMREDIYAYMCNIINISKNAQTVQTNLC